MSSQNDKTELDRKTLLAAEAKGGSEVIKTYIKLSGPGWLQSAITLGGGSLAGSLYLGIIGGYDLLWLQPLMMVFGVVMLSAIAHVALSTGERPFRALNSHVSPVLGWGWIIATMMANLVWAMPQFSLGTAALQQNLGIFNFAGGEYLCALLLFLVSAFVVWLYDASAKGYKIFDVALKVMVAVVVVSFFSVVFMLSGGDNALPWGRILAGFVPDPSLIFKPAESLRALVEQSSASEYWRDLLVSAQRDRMVAAAATAVGINMTFLLPYSMLKRGWDKTFRGLSKFDLSTALFIPFVLATSCVVIAAASQFHAKPEEGLIQMHSNPAAAESVSPKLREAYAGNLAKMLTATGRDSSDQTMAALPEPDRTLAATLIERDAFALADSLKTLGGAGTAQFLFGIGVVGMAVSTIIILMLINGFVVCEMANKPSTGGLYRFGYLLPGLSGALGALFLWSGKAKFYLAVPTGRFGMVLLPIAYIAFFCLMNNRRLLGDSMPVGRSRLIWNVLMAIGVLLALIGASISILNDSSTIPGTQILVRNVGMGLLGLLMIVAGVIHFKRRA